MIRPMAVVLVVSVSAFGCALFSRDAEPARPKAVRAVSESEGEEISVARSRERERFGDEVAATGAEETAPPRSDLAEAKNDQILLIVHEMRKPGKDEGSGLDVPWTEVRVTLRNTTKGDVDVERVTAIDGRGAFVEQLSQGEIISLAAEGLQRSIRAGQRTTGQQIAANMAMAIPGFYFWEMGRAIREGGQTNEAVQAHERLRDRVREEQITRAALASGGTLTGSAFFRIGESGLRQLVVASSAGSVRRELRVPVR